VTRTSLYRLQDLLQTDRRETTRVTTGQVYVLIQDLVESMTADLMRSQDMATENLFRSVRITGMTVQGYTLETETSCVGTVRLTGGHTATTITDTESECFLHTYTDMYITESHITATMTSGIVLTADIT
jgi:hypothetical protein